jgi:hypothetical protein
MPDGWGEGANDGSGSPARGHPGTGDAEAGRGMTGDGAPFHCPSCGEPLYARALVCPYCGAATPAGPSVRPRRAAAEAETPAPATAPPVRGDEPAASPGTARWDGRIEPRFSERPAVPAGEAVAADRAEPAVTAPQAESPEGELPETDLPAAEPTDVVDTEAVAPAAAAAETAAAFADSSVEDADADGRTRFERELEAFDRRLGIGPRDEDVPDPGFAERDFDDRDPTDADAADEARADDGRAEDDGAAEQAIDDEGYEPRRRFDDPEIVDAEFVEHRPATRDREPIRDADRQDRSGADDDPDEDDPREGDPDEDLPAGPPRRGVLDISPQTQAEPGAEAYRDLSVVPTRGGRELALPRERRRGGGLALTVIAVLVLLLVGAGGAFVWKRFGPALAESEGPHSVEVSKDWRPLDLGGGSPDRWVVSADGPYRIRVDGVVYTVTGPVPFAVPLTGGRVEVRAVSKPVTVTATLKPAP